MANEYKIPKSVQKLDYKSSNRDLTRAMDVVRKRAKRIMAKNDTNTYGAEQFNQFDTKIKELGGFKNLQGNKRTVMINELKKLSTMKSTYVKTAKAQNRRANELFGSGYRDLSHEQKSAVWREIHRQSELNLDWDSDQVQEFVSIAVNNQLHFELNFYEENGITEVDIVERGDIDRYEQVQNMSEELARAQINKLQADGDLNDYWEDFTDLL